MAEVKYLDKTGLTSVWGKVKGIVTPKADKVSGATAGHLAGLNSSGNLTDSGLAATNVAQKDGSYSGMTVGAAEDLVSAESVASEFTSRITGGSTAVGKGGTALVDKIKGRTLVWNQLVQNGAATVQSGHKYYKRINGVASIATSDGASISASNSGDMVIDLTLMFGGNEPSTPEEFDALYPLQYYDYNAGTLVSNAATAIETVGWNLFDEEMVVGNISQTDGQDTTGTSAIRSVNYIPVIPGLNYYLTIASIYPGYRVFRYGADKAYLGTVSLTQGAFTIPDDTYFIRFQIAVSVYGTVYKNDVCFSLSDPSRNGTYEPHWRSELELNIPTLTGKLNGTGNSVVIFPDGLRSAGTVFDEIVGNKAIKRIGKRSYASGDDGNVELITDGTNTYYPLATPEEYILDEAIPTAMRNDPYGTERRLPEDTAAIVTAPFRADITYSTNIKEAVQSLPQNYINVNSMQDFLAELGTLMGGTWTMRQADGKFDFTFTPNPSNE